MSNRIRGDSMSLLVKIVLVILVVILGLVFHLRNDQLITLDYILGNNELYFSIWLLIALSIGAMLGVLCSLPVIIRLKREKIKLSRQVKLSEKEITNLRVIPVKDTI
jgi:putative membrane protein